MEINKILVPVDFSELSTKALEVAGKIAAIFEAQVTPVHIHIPITELDEPYALGMSSSVYQDYDRVEANLAERLSEIAGDFISGDRLDEPVILFGNPAQSIVELSESYDFIVMSTHGRTGFSRLLLGSVAEKVLRLAHVPVMVVENESRVERFENILVTTDFSENASTAYPIAIEFAKKAGSRLHLLHILSFDQFEDDEKVPSVQNLRKERLKVTAMEAFHDIREKVTFEVIPSADSPHETILQHVKENDYNLIIMATVGRTGIKYLMMGSTTANVVRHVETAVLSINPRKADR
ncbi:MAG: universal stress protein [Balneolaceae bacterium]